MEISKSENNEEPYLSGAHIRSFVKQLTASRSSSMKKNGSLERERVSREEGKDQNAPRKKQVRRRLHTRRPYQEKMLNMAEARREIVTALKLHRANMKQAKEKQQARQVTESGPEPEPEVKSRRNPRIYASNSIAYSSPGFYSTNSWPVSSIAPSPIFHENVDFALPSQTLGLNLNLQEFTIYSSSSPSTSSSSSSFSPPLSVAADEITVVGAATSAEAEAVGFEDQRCKFPKSVEIKAEDDEDFVNSPFEEVMEFPAWLNANENLQQPVNDIYYFQDSALPCMEIEEIEGMDGDWLA